MDLLFLDGLDIDNALIALSEPTKYQGYLQVMSHFSNYSWRNVLLIYMQMPHATMLADFKRWKEQHGRTVIKGSKTIKINAPIEQKPIKKLVKKIDPNTGIVMLDDNGKMIMEEIITETSVQFKEVRLLDISQTEGKPVMRLAGDVVSDDSLHCVFVDILRGLMPQSSTTKVDSDMPTDIFNDIKFIALDRLESLTNTDLGSITFIATSIAYVVCLRFRVDVNAGLIAFDRPAQNLIDGDMLEVICNQSEVLISTIEDRFALICKERNLDPLILPKSIKPITPTIFTNPAPLDELKTKEEPPKLTAEPQKEVIPQVKPTYTTELSTSTVAGIEFSQFTVKPVTTSETTIPTPPASPTLRKKQSPLKHPPDPTITIADRNQYGYTRPELLPLTKDCTINLFKRDMVVYMLHKDNTEVMVHYLSDIQNHDGIFGITSSTWQNSKEYIALASGNPEAILESKYLYDD